jgi:beta-glucosidase
VLLKNDGAILPLKPQLNVLVAGDGANDVGKQAGGWTIGWQGTGNTRADFPHAQSIYEGIAEQVKAAGGTTTVSTDGSFSTRPDVAVVVFGENPYAEFQGDIDTLDYQPGDPRDLALIKGLRAKGIPVIAVFLSGRPLYTTPEINASNAFVAAWLPGSEGGGVADLLFRKPDGSTQYDFHGQLSFSWPRTPTQTPLNVGDANYDPLFAFGYGLTYKAPRDLGQLAEAPGGEGAASNLTRYLGDGAAVPPWTLSLIDAKGAAVDARRPPAATADKALAVTRDGKVLLAIWKTAQ